MPHMDAALHRQNQDASADYNANSPIWTRDATIARLNGEIESLQWDYDMLQERYASLEKQKFLWLGLGMILSFVLLYMYKKVRRN